jgi:predicted DsbA family dithiol-disulfide isomerase
MECDEETGICRVPGAARDQGEAAGCVNVGVDVPESQGDKNKIRIDIISDNSCPWCWVGKRKMEKAMKLFPEVRFEVVWYPFFLASPLAEPERRPVLELLTRKYGPSFERMNAALKTNGEQLGIKFNDDRIEVNTLQSHRLVDFAKKFGIPKQNEVIEAIFEAYFANARDISNKDVLVDLAKTVGLNEEEVRKFLRGGERADEVMEEATKKRKQFRVNGVPFFLISLEGQSHAIKLSGAQDPSTFKAAFKQLLDDGVPLRLT